MSRIPAHPAPDCTGLWPLVFVNLQPATLIRLPKNPALNNAIQNQKRCHHDRHNKVRVAVNECQSIVIGTLVPTNGAVFAAVAVAVVVAAIHTGPDTDAAATAPSITTAITVGQNHAGRPKRW